MKLAWGNHPSITEARRAQVIAIAAEIGCDPSHLMACMYFESRLDPRARNPVSNATGLIQFMPATAQGLGTTVDIIRDMSFGSQLGLVREYFLPYVGRLKTLSDLYMAILYPRAIGKPEDFVIFPAGSKAEAQNRGLDINHDGQVTKAEAASFVEKRLYDGLLPGNVYDGDVAALPAPINAPEKPVLPLLTALLPTVLGMFTQRSQTQLETVKTAPPDVLGGFLQTLFASITKQTGQSDPVQAVAALKTAPVSDVQAVEAEALDYLDKLQPVLAKLAEYEAQAWAAEEASKDAAAKRGLQAQEAGPLWNNPTFLISGFVLFMTAAVVGAVLFKGGFSTDMQSYVIASVISALMAVLGYWVGSTRQSGAKDVIIGEMARQSKS